MIKETVEVVGIEGEQVVVRSARTSACAQCDASASCGQKSIAEWASSKWVDVPVINPDQKAVRIGDKVVVGIEEGRFVLASALVYLMPLVLMMAFALTGFTVGLDEAGLIGLSMAGLLVGFVLNRVLNQRESTSAHQYQPVLLRVYQTK